MLDWQLFTVVSVFSVLTAICPCASSETYVRWGRTSCPGGASLVYDGYAAGNAFNKRGSGTNFLCLPRNPEFKKYTSGMDLYSGRIFGVEYEISKDKPYPRRFHNQDMPCAVCLTRKRSTVLMVPGKINCHSGWHKEFSGYLMSEYTTNQWSQSEYICVDESLESLPGGSANTNHAVVYPVEPVCGSLKCPPYENGKELTCVVCSI
ncbi:short-chain collagen C4-like [Mytilus californianus]|uniref:short-chain collagen C4-like n=1 Tax=Mytilus californianus TaxID=6549 RepID=UPI0022486332|nr:short-chain collagen C4-like [Mytilus californianus]